MANRSAMGTCAAIGFCNKAAIEKLLDDGLLQVAETYPILQDLLRVSFTSDLSRRFQLPESNQEKGLSRHI